ncbi:N-methyl-L-tryptophan oxidase [Spirillospora sp. NPDC052242]
MAHFDADIGVVGLGAWGSATLWRLAHRGVDVLGFERFEPGHAFGSSHGGSRMFRLTCYEHPGLVALAKLSLDLWRTLEATAGVPLLDLSGGLLIGAPDGRMISETLANARDFDIDVERLDATELKRRFPQHENVAAGHVGVWEPSAGLLRPEAAVRAAVTSSVRIGARVYSDTRVVRIEPVSGGVVLHTPTGKFRVRRTIVAVGPWCATLIPRLPLKTIRKPITWFAPEGSPGEFSVDRFPMFKRECGDGRVLWGCGAYDGDDVKLGLETKGRVPPEIDPDVLDRSTSVADWDELGRVVSSALPGVRPVPTRVSVCMGTHSPDDQFVLGPVGGDLRLIVATGESSQGFKHATGIGEFLAQTAVGETPTVALPFTDPDRFLTEKT